ncbi:MAG: hypothetical protein ACPIOQ_42550, partial [Promethearchaeia archaeon]
CFIWTKIDFPPSAHDQYAILKFHDHLLMQAGTLIKPLSPQFKQEWEKNLAQVFRRGFVHEVGLRRRML